MSARLATWLAVGLGLLGASGACERGHRLGAVGAPDGDASADAGDDAADAGAGDDGDGAAGTGGDDAGSDDAIPELVRPVRGCNPDCDLAHSSCVGGVCTAGARRWLTLGGDDHHTGWAMNETGGPPARRAWRVQVSANVQPDVWPVVADDDTVYAVDMAIARRMGPVLDQVWALAARDGATRWSADFSITSEFPAVVTLGMPTLSEGRLYVTQGGGSTALNAFVDRTGKLAWSLLLDEHSGTDWAPLVLGYWLYMRSGRLGGLAAFDVDVPAPVFVDKATSDYDAWSALPLDGAIYTFTDGTLTRYDAVVGDAAVVSTVAAETMTYSQNGAPVSDGTTIYAVQAPSLYALRPDAAQPLWHTTAAYAGMPAVAGGVLYAVSGGRLVAHDPATGEPAWSFTGDGALSFAPAVASRWVYVASPANVYAVDTTTHQMAWQAAPGGWLSIAAGQLLVAEPDGFVSAYPLTGAP
jgi:hypothetical protein